MGRKFGKVWELEVNSPAEALRLIEANKPGLRAWMIENAGTYDAYHVVCEYEDGRTEELDDKTFFLNRKLKGIRFTPVVKGSGGVFQAIVGVIAIVVGVYTGNPYLISFGASMFLGGVVQMLSPRPTKDRNNSSDWVSSNYFDGPVNTELQGAPVPLIYGRVMVGAHPISASITVDEVAP